MTRSWHFVTRPWRPTRPVNSTETKSNQARLDSVTLPIRSNYRNTDCFFNKVLVSNGIEFRLISSSRCNLPIGRALEAMIHPKHQCRQFNCTSFQRFGNAVKANRMRFTSFDQQLPFPSAPTTSAPFNPTWKPTNLIYNRLMKAVSSSQKKKKQW